MRTHYIKITTWTHDKCPREYFEPVTAMQKCFRFKGQRQIKRLEAWHENVEPLILGFDEDIVMILEPGQVLEFQEERWTRELHMRRGMRTFVTK